jgi:protein-S-isoprenylcysteine O-methyltransferase Ste14
MSRSSALILLGVLVVLTPLSGLPQSWITFLLAVFGIIIALIGIAMRTSGPREAHQVPTASMLTTESTDESEPAAHHHEHPSSIA